MQSIVEKIGNAKQDKYPTKPIPSSWRPKVQPQQYFPYFSGFQLDRDTKLVYEAILLQGLLLPIILTLSYVPVRWPESV